MQMYTDRQMALQAAVEMSKNSSYINNSFDVVAVAERFRKFLEEGVVETKNGAGSVNGAVPTPTTTGDKGAGYYAVHGNNKRWMPYSIGRVGNG